MLCVYSEGLVKITSGLYEVRSAAYTLSRVRTYSRPACACTDHTPNGQAAGRVANQRWLLIPHLPHLPHPLTFFLPASRVVRDLSHTSVSIAPADYSSWHDVRTELMAEAKSGFKARVEAELAAAGGENLDELKAAFQQEERAIEHAIDHEVHTFSATLDVSYNFLSH